MYLDFFRKGSTEHHGLSNAFRGHGVLFNDASDLRFKSHVQHTISLIQNQVTKVKREREREAACFHHCDVLTLGLSND